jgi:hypothetical protein
MPLNFADPFGRIGGAAGAGAGGILGGLSQLLEPLDYVRQAAWNLIKKPIDAITEGDPSHLAGMIPGIAGLAGTLLAGPWGGAGAAMLGQGLGKAIAPEQFKAPEVSDITGTEDVLPNLLVGAVTDPMTYMGGLKGFGLGKKAGQEFGTGMEQAARQMGPGYKGGLENLYRAFPEEMLKGPASLPFHERVGMIGSQGWKPDDFLSAHVRAMMQNPEVLSELAPESKFLGRGAETISFTRPDAGVTNFTRNTLDFPGYPRIPATRADIPDVIQAARSVQMDPFRVEHMPFMRMGTSEARTPEELARLGQQLTDMRGLQQKLLGQNVGWWDYKPENMGYAPTRVEPFVTDPGSIVARRVTAKPGRMSETIRPWETDIPVPLAPELPGQKPGPIKSALLRMLGAEKGVQEEIAQGVRQYRGGRPLESLGYKVPDLGELGTGMTPTEIVPGIGGVRPSELPLLDSSAAERARRLAEISGSPVRPSELAQAQEILNRQLSAPSDLEHTRRLAEAGDILPIGPRARPPGPSPKFFEVGTPPSEGLAGQRFGGLPTEPMGFPGGPTSPVTPDIIRALGPNPTLDDILKAILARRQVNQPTPMSVTTPGIPRTITPEFLERLFGGAPTSAPRITPGPPMLPPPSPW